MKWLIVLLVLLVLYLQYRLWVGEGSMAEVVSLEQAIERQQQDLQEMAARNRSLQAEIDSLKHDLAEVEERARSDLGMVRDGEVFFQVVEGAAKEKAPGEAAK